jgi:hypothetical protein
MRFSKLRLGIAAFLAALVALPVLTADAEAAVVDYRSTGTCSVVGTVWNMTSLYHRDSTTGSVKSYGFNVSRKSGTGTLRSVYVDWYNHGILGEYLYPETGSSNTNTGDQIYGWATPDWEASQQLIFKISSPSSGGTRTSTCLMTIT